MFIYVQDLTYNMDDTIKYVKEAKEYHTCSEEEYNQYLEKMHKKLDNMLDKLKQISCNKKLISKYEKKVNEIKWFTWKSRRGDINEITRRKEI